jgi:signal transduction histidine kinase
MGKTSPIARAPHSWVLIICLVASLLIAGAYYYAERQQITAQIEGVSQTYAERTTNHINSIFHKTDTLAAVVKLHNGDIDEETFNSIARIVYEEDQGIRGIQYMPGAVVTYSYPLEGNESVMGKNFFDIPERRADVLLAIETRSIALSGPYNLIQGGLGLVARNPVFLADDNGNEYFWGFSAIVLDLPDALQSVGLDRLTENGYDFQLFSVNENGERLVIQGDENLDVSTATCSTIEVPHHEWTLAVKEHSPLNSLLKALFVLGMCVLISLLVWHRYRISVLEKAAIQMRERFFSDVTHDMRTPLNAIINFSAFGQEEDLSLAQKNAYFKKIGTSGDLLLELVNETLTLSKAESGAVDLKMEPIGLRAFTDAVATPLRPLCEDKHLTFTIDLDGYSDTTVLADRIVLQKTLMNLLSNAVKYTPEGGHVALSLRRAANDKGIVFSVKDDGIGISEEFLPHIYEPFTQEHRSGYGSSGTGLGLSIVSQMVKLMHGDIAVHTKKNEGSEFVVTLPLQQTDRTPEDQEHPSGDNAQFAAGAHILVCEDNALNQEIARILLQKHGAIAVIADDGRKGVDLFAASDPYSFDAILMDVRMPMMDGLEATRAIRALDRPDAASVPIIAMTADAFESAIQDCLDAGMNAHVAKPVDEASLIRTLSNQIHRAHHED